MILPCFNSAKTIQRTLESIITQSVFDLVELIVIDGDSTDETISILSRYPQIAKLISEKDEGITDAWNKALYLITAEWVFFIGSDDYLYDPYVFEKFLESVKNTPHNIVYGKVLLVGENENFIKECSSPWSQLKKRFFKTSCLPHQGVFTRKSAFEKFGVFDKAFKITADYDFLLRVLKQEDPLHLPNLTVTYFFTGGVSSNLSSRFQALSEIRGALRKNGFNGWNLIALKGVIFTSVRLVSPLLSPSSPSSPSHTSK